MSQFILLIRGPMCAGKSTVVELLMSRHKNIFRSSYDKIKWLISDFTPETHHTTVHDFVLALVEVALEKNMTVVGEGLVFNNGWQKYEALAKKHGIPFFEVNIEAPIEILKKRFGERIQQATKNGDRISINTEDGMVKRYQQYKDGTKHDIPTFDSSVLTAEEIVVQIEKLVRLA